MSEKTETSFRMLPNDILADILHWVHGIGIARLELTGDTVFTQRMREKGLVKRYFMDWAYDTKILAWPSLFMSYPLTHFSYYRGNVLSSIPFAFTIEHLLSLPSTLEHLALGGYNAESVFSFTRLALQQYSKQNDISMFVSTIEKKTWLNVSKRFPNLTSLILRENGNGPHFDHTIIPLLPPNLRYLSLYWNGTMTLTGTSFLQNVTTLLLPNISLFTTFPSRRTEVENSPSTDSLVSSDSVRPLLPPTLTKLAIQSLSLPRDDLAVTCLPAGLASLQTIVKLPLEYSSSICSFLPNRLTRLCYIMVSQGQLPTLPATITCLGIGAESTITLDQIINYPPSLIHLQIRRGTVNESVLRSLPRSLKVLRIGIKIDFSIPSFKLIQPQYLPNLLVLDLRSFAQDGKYQRSHRHLVSDLQKSGGDKSI
jgi:hypothetical protein